MKRHIEITDVALDVNKANAFVTSETNGAVVIFNGIVRKDNPMNPTQYLEFEAYLPMVEEEMIRIIQEVSLKVSISTVYFAHRIGRVHVGESAVIVGVSSKHRKEAFMATEAIMEELKKRVPIWKKEHTQSGAHWVVPHP
jgi:molybdopterin synthase catalytic subunit